MRLQFGTLLADIGLIDLPKDSMVCLFHRVGRLCFQWDVWVENKSALSSFLFLRQKTWNIYLIETNFCRLQSIYLTLNLQS